MMTLDRYEKWRFEADLPDGKPAAFDVYEKGEGPVVLILQELPGIGQETLGLARFFIDNGYRVVMPHFIGPLGKTATLRNTLRLFCMRREFTVFAKGKSSPLTAWIRALCRELKEKRQVNGIGVIGMCLTGNFALSMMADESVLAAVASQPSLPIGKDDDLHLTDEDVTRIRERLDHLPPMQAWRFEKDPLCKAARFDALDKAFNDEQRNRIELGVVPGVGHAVLTVDFVDEQGHPTWKARQKVLEYFETALKAF